MALPTVSAVVLCELSGSVTHAAVWPLLWLLVELECSAAGLAWYGCVLACLGAAGAVRGSCCEQSSVAVLELLCCFPFCGDCGLRAERCCVVVRWWGHCPT
jgi:hypothetical protein